MFVFEKYLIRSLMHKKLCSKVCGMAKPVAMTIFAEWNTVLKVPFHKLQ